MAVTNKHSLYAVSVHAVADSSATILGGITRQSILPGTNVTGEATSGETYRRFLSVTSANPTASFTTLQIAAGLGLVPFAGKLVNADGSHPGMVFYAQKHADGATRTSGSAHRTYTCKKGLIVPTSIEASHQGNATMTCSTTILFDGTNDPIVPADSAALATAPSDAERFTIGKCTVGGVVITHLRSMSINFGINVAPESADSDIWPTFASISVVNPSITLRGINVETWKDSGGLPIEGLACTHANTTLYLRKRTATGFVADATAEHISFTTAGLATLDTGFDGSGSEAAEVSLTIDCSYDGTNAPIVIDTTAAIV